MTLNNDKSTSCNYWLTSKSDNFDLEINFENKNKIIINFQMENKFAIYAACNYVTHFCSNGLKLSSDTILCDLLEKCI